jgi:phosphatidyl-myo-inositol dimannoside synthase
MREMKVLFVALAIHGRIGGMERFNQRVVQCLSELGSHKRWESEVVAYWDSPEHVHRILPHVHVTPGASNKLKTSSNFARLAWANQPDIILYGHVLLTPLAVLAKVLSPHSRHVLFVHGIEVWGDQAHRKIFSSDRWSVRFLIDHIVSVSRFTARRMEITYCLRGKSVSLLPNAVDIDDSRPIAFAAMVPLAGRHPLLTVTRLTLKDRYKGCDKVIRAIPKVLSVFPDAHYYIVGEGRLRIELQTLAEEMNVAEHVHFLGYLSDEQLEGIYDASHLFVMPSGKEGFGIVFLEAWKHGLPVIAGNRDASPEVVTHGINGLTVNPESTEEIAESIIWIMRNPEVYARMRENAVQTVRQSYTHEHFRSTLSKVLLDISSGRLS